MSEVTAGIERLERLGKKRSEVEKKILKSNRRFVRRYEAIHRDFERLGGQVWTIWLNIQDQRDTGMGVGALRIEAVDVIFRWLRIPVTHRQEIWLTLKQLDGLFVRFHNKKKDEDQK